MFLKAIVLAAAMFCAVTRSLDGHVVGDRDDLYCYPQVGCFSPGTGPLAHLDMVPADPDLVGTEFLVWTDPRRPDPVVIPASEHGDLGRLVPELDPGLPFVVIVHGFGDAARPNEGWAEVMKTRLHTHMNATIVAVNWEKGAYQDNYVVAARNSELVGRQVGNLVDTAMAMGVTANRVHFIGHSLGAQIANFAGYWIRQISDVDPDFTPGRITGLDPAGPYFCDEDYGPDTYLERTDARYVDVYHTNQGKLSYGNVGCEKQVGHADFYPNGGYDQPGCPNPIVGIIEDIFTDGNYASCSHIRSIQIFSESLVAGDDLLWGFPCPGLDDFDNDFVTGDCFRCDGGNDARGCGKIGLDAPKHGRGAFYLLTFGADPAEPTIPTFAGRMTRVSVFSSPTQGQLTYGQFTVTIYDENGQHEPFPVTTVDAPISEGERKSYVFLRNETFSSEQTYLGALVEYTAYTDGFFDGKPYWFIDKVMVEDDREHRYYSCKPLLQLETGEPQPMTLSKTPC